MNRLRYCVFWGVILYSISAYASDTQWGHLSGRFICTGDVPAAKTIQVTRDEKVFGDAITDESLIVHTENGGIANVVVYLDRKKPAVPVHPSYEKDAAAKLDLAMQGGRFIPRLLLVRTTQTIVLRNKDDVGHAAQVFVMRNPPIGPIQAANSQFELRYDKEEYFPCSVRCSIHPWMRGYVLLRSNPYMAKTDANGRFNIKHLPVGKHVFRIWHERSGYLRNVQIGATTADGKGRLSVHIRGGQTELKACSIESRVFASNN